MMKTSEVLARGRERIARGWIQGAFHQDDRYCMRGAISLRLHTPLVIDEYTAAVRELSEKIGEMFPSGPWIYAGRAHIARFNDAKARTQEEVLSVFDKAILSAQERGD